MVAQDVGTGYELSPEEEREITAAAEEIGRGKFVTGDEVLRRLSTR